VHLQDDEPAVLEVPGGHVEHAPASQYLPAGHRHTQDPAVETAPGGHTAQVRGELDDKEGEK
jgi:hypothetical protein